MTLIKGIASIGAAVLLGLFAPPARAGYVVDLTQHGSNVVATGSGPIDLTGLSFFASSAITGSLSPVSGSIATGPVSPTNQDLYTGFTGPNNFGGGLGVFANSGSGDMVAVLPGFAIGVPHGYVSDAPLSDTSTYNGFGKSGTFLTPGAYEWTWGTGANQNFTLVVRVAAIPEPSTWAMMLLGLAGLGFMGYQAAGRRRRTARHA
jgi:hypothetical protein